MVSFTIQFFHFISALFFFIHVLACPSSMEYPLIYSSLEYLQTWPVCEILLICLQLCSQVAFHRRFLIRFIGGLTWGILSWRGRLQLSSTSTFGPWYQEHFYKHLQTPGSISLMYINSRCHNESLYLTIRTTLNCKWTKLLLNQELILSAASMFFISGHDELQSKIRFRVTLFFESGSISLFRMSSTYSYHSQRMIEPPRPL